MATISFSSTANGKKKNRLEIDVQKECWRHLNTLQIRCFADLTPIRMLQDFAYMVPNGTQLAGGRERRGMAMANLKAQGFRPGVSDIVIALPQGDYHGAFIELKKEPHTYGGPKAIKSRRTAIRPEQRDWINLMLDQGYWASVAWGTEDFKRLVSLFLRSESPPAMDWDERPCDTVSAQ